MRMPEGYVEMNDTEREQSGKGQWIVTERHCVFDPNSKYITRYSKYDIEGLFMNQKCEETVRGYMGTTEDGVIDLIQESNVSTFYDRRLNEVGRLSIGAVGVVALVAGFMGLAAISD